jgi:hypothetical protein
LATQYGHDQVKVVNLAIELRQGLFKAGDGCLPGDLVRRLRLALRPGRAQTRTRRF